MANISCSHNVIKKDGTTGGLFPLVSSMFPNRALEFYNAVMSRPVSILSTIKNNGVGFTRNGIVLSPTLDFNQTVALIKKIDPKAVFTYDVSRPLYNEKENRYNMSKIDMGTIIPKTDKTLEDIYNEDRGFKYDNSNNKQNNNIKEATEWINKVMPNANVELVEELIDGIGKGSYNTVADLIQLSEKYANKFSRIMTKKEAEEKGMNLVNIKPSFVTNKLIDNIATGSYNLLTDEIQISLVETSPEEAEKILVKYKKVEKIC